MVQKTYIFLWLLNYLRSAILFKIITRFFCDDTPAWSRTETSGSLLDCFCLFPASFWLPSPYFAEATGYHARPYLIEADFRWFCFWKKDQLCLWEIVKQLIFVEGVRNERKWLIISSSLNTFPSIMSRPGALLKSQFFSARLKSSTLNSISLPLSSSLSIISSS